MLTQHRQASEIKNFFNVNITDSPIDIFIDNLILSFHNDPINIMSINGTSINRFDQEMFDFTKKFHFVTADGNGFVKLSGLFGTKIKNQIPISTLSEKIISLAAKKQFRIYLLGSTIINNNLAQNAIHRLYPELEVFGHHGYFNDDELELIISEIIQCKPNIILVGISSPKKERVILKISKHYSPSINIACGGYIDILAGKIRRAPIIIQKISVEWIYRFLQEPRRLFKPMIIGGLVFIFRIVPRAFYYSRIIKRRVDLHKITR